MKICKARVTYVEGYDTAFCGFLPMNNNEWKLIKIAFPLGRPTLSVYMAEINKALAHQEAWPYQKGKKSALLYMKICEAKVTCVEGYE